MFNAQPGYNRMLKVAIIDYGGRGVFINENIHTNQPIYLFVYVYVLCNVNNC